MVALVGSHRSFIHVETFFSTRRRRGSRNRAERKPDFIIWDTTPPPPPPPPCIASHHTMDWFLCNRCLSSFANARQFKVRDLSWGGPEVCFFLPSQSAFDATGRLRGRALLRSSPAAVTSSATPACSSSTSPQAAAVANAAPSASL